MAREDLLTSQWLPENSEMKPLLQVYEEHLTERVYSAGTTIFRQRDILTSAFFILSGTVKCFMTNFQGNTRMLYVASTGTLVGAVPAIDQYPSQVSAVALGDVHGWSVPYDLLRVLLMNDGQLAARLYLALSRQQRLAVKLVSDASLRCASEQVRCLLHHLVRQSRNQNPPIILETTQQDLADLLGVTRCTVAQQLGDLRRERIVDTGRGKIQVLDPERLRSCSETTFCVSCVIDG